MTSNFDEYKYILQARKSNSFKELDDKVRSMTIELGKGKGNKKEYIDLLKKRDKELADFVDSVKEKEPCIQFSDKTDGKISKLLESYIEKFPNTKLKNIIMSGATGTGKTYCAKIIEQKLTQNGFSVYFTTTFNLVKRMNDNMYGQDPSATADLIESDLLIIDDLGTEPTIKNSDEFLYVIVNERYINNKHFIITTNLSNEQILGRYDQRFFGRIFDKTKTAVINFQGKDFRIE